ncbi:MAG: glycosyltransferase family 39 protein [Nanoarchaeota archaeon]
MRNKNLFAAILLVFFILVTSKIVIAYFVKSPTVFADEYYYMKMARSFFYHGNFFIDNTFTASYPPLYPMTLSVSYMFHDMRIVYFAMKVINALVSSLIIFPLYLLAREFLDRKNSLLISGMISIMPPFFSISPYILSENLFYTLFVFSIYFIYKAFSKKRLKYDFFAGLFIALTMLTRVIGIILIAIFIIVLLLRRKDFNIKKTLVVLIPIVLVIPWIMLVNFYLSLPGIIKNTGYDLTISNILSTKYFIHAFFWIPIILTYFILASGFIFFVAYLLFMNKKYLDDKLKIFYSITTVTILMFLLLASFYILAYQDLDNILIGRPIERYFAPVLALIVLSGYIAIYNNILRKSSYKSLSLIAVLLSICFLLSTPLILYSLFPANNPSLIYLGVMSTLINMSLYYKLLVFGIIFFILPYMAIHLYRLRMINLVRIFIIFFALVSILDSSFTILNSNTRWYTLEQTRLGLWMNDYDNGKSTILFDKIDINRDFRWSKTLEQRERSIGVIGFWLNNEIIVGDINLDKARADYIISTQKLEYTVVNYGKSSDIRNIYIYKINDASL